MTETNVPLRRLESWVCALQRFVDMVSARFRLGQFRQGAAMTKFRSDLRVPAAFVPNGWVTVAREEREEREDASGETPQP
jgi:hypothetical protein